MDSNDGYFIMLQNLQNACRSCLKNKSSMISLFDGHILEKTVAGLYKYVTELDAKIDDNLPKYLCMNCFEKLQDAHAIKKMSIDSHFMLKNLHKKEEQIEELIPEPEEEFEIIEEVMHSSDIPGTSRQYTESPTTVKIEPECMFDEIIENPLEECEPIDEMMEIRNKQNKPQKINTNPTFFCDTCQTEVHCNKSYHIKEHRKYGIEPIKKCEICDKKYFIQNDFINHSCIPTVKDCKICQITFPCRDDFKKHLKDSHFEDGFYKCPEENCSEKESTVRDAFYHITWHKNPVDLICYICGMIFKCSSRLSRHTSQHKKNEFRGTCDYCSKEIAGKMNLFRHMKSRHLKLKYFCELCPKNYTDVSVLKAHKIKEHGLESPHVCKQCGEPFLFLSQLNNHHSQRHCKRMNMLLYGTVHRPRLPRRPQEELEKIYKCPNCDRYFNNSRNRDRHNKQVHLKLKPFACQFCTKAFGQKTELQTHTRTHTGEKPFGCKLCDVRYGDRSSLHKHVKSRHKESL